MDTTETPEHNELAVQQHWLIQHCATPGCFTAIRVRAGTQDTNSICNWCQAGTSHAMLGRAAVDIRLRPVLLATVLLIECLT